MATLTIKNVPDELYQQLKESAAKHRRSINNEAIVSLEKALGSARKADTEELLARARESRERLARSGIFVTEEDLRKAKEWGRP